MPAKRIAITGIGPITSIGIGKDKLWKGILQEKTNVKLKKFRLDGEIWDKYYVHKVEGFDIANFDIDKDALNYIYEWKEEEPPLDLYYLLASIQLALEDSRLKINSSKNNTGLVLAHENLGLMPFAFKISQKAFDIFKNKSLQNLSRKEFHQCIYKDCLKTGYDVQTFMSLFHVAKVFNIHNYSLFINNACASGLYALEAASQMIKCNQNSSVIVAASDYTDIYKYLWFRDIGLYSKDGKVRPFCKDSNGLVFGDGAVALILEDLAQAKKRKAKIYAEYLGGGFSLEGWKVTTPQIGSNSYQEAIRQAFLQSGINKKELDLLCPHGFGYQTTDYYEAKAITDTFGNNYKKPLISAFKPYVGHNLGGSALLETAILLLSLTNNLIPATLNCENLDPKFNIDLVTKSTKAKLNTVMKICCAFAGYNAAAIFRKPD